MEPSRSYNAILVGHDPGLATHGFAAVGLRAGGSEDILALDVFRSAKSDKKRQTLAAEDNVRRGDELCEWLEDRYFALHRFGKIRAVCAESMSFPRSSSAAAKMSISWGVIICMRHARRLPLVQSSPQEIKLALCKKKDASKADIKAALLKRYAGKGVERYLAHIPTSAEEHGWDSLASIVCALNSDVARALR